MQPLNIEADVRLGHVVDCCKLGIVDVHFCQHPITSSRGTLLTFAIATKQTTTTHQLTLPNVICSFLFFFFNRLRRSPIYLHIWSGRACR